jgi:hypothetical protein
MTSLKSRRGKPDVTGLDAGAGAMSAVSGRGSVPTAGRFKPGQSGNPGGRPRSLPRFRRGSRDVAFALLTEVRERLADKDPQTRPALAELVDALTAIAPFGGFLAADKQAVVEASSAKLLLLALAIKDLPEDKRTALLGLLGDSKA